MLVLVCARSSWHTAVALSFPHYTFPITHLRDGPGIILAERYPEPDSGRKRRENASDAMVDEYAQQRLNATARL
ncbi:hypothetical protein EDB85DRAFT_774280 [Lactarius pseudohatsudake]|nr:hypothetical protein EDB85DRAFT_774280 [Lactarius pseudohatsudake]